MELSGNFTLSAGGHPVKTNEPILVPIDLGPTLSTGPEHEQFKFGDQEVHVRSQGHTRPKIDL